MCNRHGTESHFTLTATFRNVDLAPKINILKFNS